MLEEVEDQGSQTKATCQNAMRNITTNNFVRAGGYSPQEIEAKIVESNYSLAKAAKARVKSLATKILKAPEPKPKNIKPK